MLYAAGFPATPKDKTSILSENRLNFCILEVLRIVGFFVVLIVVWDESLYVPLKSLSHVHHAVFSFLVLLQRNQHVDSVVLEHLLYSTRVPIFSRFEFFPLLLQYRSGLLKQFHQTEQSAPQSTQYLTKKCGICHLCAIIPKWFCNHHAWVGELSAVSPWPCCTCVAVRKLHVWHHGWGSFWSRNLELIGRHSSSSQTLWYFARVLDFFHMSNTQCQFPNILHNRDIVSWKRFRKARRSRYCPCRWQLLRLFV